MDLESFIEQSLVQIINGVRKAQAFAPRYGYDGRDGDTVNPRVMERADHSPKKHYTTHSGDLVQLVSFDVAITVESGSEAKGSGGLKVLGIGSAEAGGKLSESSASVSRLKFDVPMVLPNSGMVDGTD